MNRSSTNTRHDVVFPQQQGNHSCSLCSKSYKSATWLDHHIKTKHSTRLTQDQSEMLAHISNSYRTSMSNTVPLSQSFKELHQPTLTRDLSTMLTLLNQLLPLMECLLPILEQLDGVSSSAPPMRRRTLLNPKRRASSQDLRGESGTKRRELSTSISEACFSGVHNESENYPNTTALLPDSGHSGDPHRAQNTGSMATLTKGDHFKLDGPTYLPSIPRHSYSGQTNSSQGPHSHSRTPYYQAPNGALPRQRHQLRLFQAPRIHGQSENTAQIPHVLEGLYQSPPSSGERIPRQYEHSMLRLNSAQPFRDATPPNSDALLQFFVETPYQELDQQQSALQGLQQDSSSPGRQASQHSVGDCLDDSFQDWNLLATPNLGFSDFTMSVEQLTRSLEEGDDRVHLDHSIL